MISTNSVHVVIKTDSKTLDRDSQEYIALAFEEKDEHAPDVAVAVVSILRGK